MTFAKHARGSSLPTDLSVCGSSSKSQNKAAAELCGPCAVFCIIPIITTLLQKVKEQRHLKKNYRVNLLHYIQIFQSYRDGLLDMTMGLLSLVRTCE